MGQNRLFHNRGLVSFPILHKNRLPAPSVRAGRAGPLPRSGRSLRQSKRPPQKLFDIPILFLFLAGFQLFSARGQGKPRPVARPRQSKKGRLSPSRAPGAARPADVPLFASLLFGRQTLYGQNVPHRTCKSGRRARVLPQRAKKAAGIPAGRFMVCVTPCRERWLRQPARRPARDAENKCTAHRTQSRGCPLPV